MNSTSFNIVNILLSLLLAAFVPMGCSNPPPKIELGFEPTQINHKESASTDGCHTAASIVGLDGTNFTANLSQDNQIAQSFSVKDVTKLKSIQLFGADLSAAYQNELRIAVYEASEGAHPNNGRQITFGSFPLKSSQFGKSQKTRATHVFQLPEPWADLKAHTQYWIVLSATKPFAAVTGFLRGAYPFGRYQRYAKGKWTDRPTEDLYFVINGCQRVPPKED